MSNFEDFMIGEAVDLRAELRKSEAKNRQLVEALHAFLATLRDKAYPGHIRVDSDEIGECFRMADEALSSDAEAAE